MTARTALPQDAVLLIVDVQKGMDVYAKEYNRNNPDLEANIAFIGTTLEADLRRRGLTTLIVVGMQTNMCVSTTARMAGNLGFTTYVVSDATATFDNTGPNGQRYASELLHDVALADLHGEFSTVIDTKTALAAT